MAGVTDTLPQENYCLICSAVVSPTKNGFLNRLEAVFLLKVLLEIPYNNPLIYQVQSSSQSLPVCVICGCLVKQCKKNYTQISAQIKQLWDFQLNLANKLLVDPKSNHCNSLVHQCREYVKKNNFKDSFKYPFTVHDLSKLLISESEPQLLTEDIPIQNDPAFSSADQEENDEPFVNSNQTESLGTPSSLDQLDVTSRTSIEISDVFVLKQETTTSDPEKEFESNDDDNEDYSDEHSSAEDESSSSNDSTPSTSKNVRRRKRNNGTERRKAANFSCTWPGCGKSMTSNYSLQTHLNKHRGKPQEKCHFCPKLFYWASDRRRHQKDVHGITPKCERKITLKRTLGLDVNAFTQDPITKRYNCPEPKCKNSRTCKSRIINHYKEDHLNVKSFICEYPDCKEKTFNSKYKWQGHMDMHKKTPRYKCSQCDKGYYWRAGLQYHQKRENH